MELLALSHAAVADALHLREGAWGSIIGGASGARVPALPPFTARALDDEEEVYEALVCRDFCFSPQQEAYQREATRERAHAQR